MPTTEDCMRCTKPFCPQAKLAHDIALGRMYATNELLSYVKKVDSGQLVEVVRCKECKHWHESTGYCEKHSYFIGADGMSCSPAESPSWTMWDADGFCSDGERKGGDGNG